MIPNSELDSSTPVGFLIELVGLADVEEHFDSDHCSHSHLANSIVDDCYFGKVSFLGPLIWKDPLEVVTISPPPITLVRVVSGLLMLVWTFLPAFVDLNFNLKIIPNC